MKIYDRIVLDIKGEPLPLYLFGMVGLKDSRIRVVSDGDEESLSKELTPTTLLLHCDLQKWEGGEDELRPDYVFLKATGDYATSNDFHPMFSLASSDNVLIGKQAPGVPVGPKLDFFYSVAWLQFWEEDFLTEDGEMDMEAIGVFQSEMDDVFVMFLEDFQDVFGFFTENIPLILRHKDEILSRPLLCGIDLGIPRNEFFVNLLVDLGQILTVIGKPELALKGFERGDEYIGWPVYFYGSDSDCKDDVSFLSAHIWCPELGRTLINSADSGYVKWMVKANDLFEGLPQKDYSLNYWTVPQLVAALKDIESGKQVLLPYEVKS